MGFLAQVYLAVLLESNIYIENKNYQGTRQTTDQNVWCRTELKLTWFSNHMDGCCLQGISAKKMISPNLSDSQLLMKVIYYFELSQD